MQILVLLSKYQNNLGGEQHLLLSQGYVISTQTLLEQ